MKRPALFAAIVTALLATMPVAFAATPQTRDITSEFRTSGAVVNNLQVYELAGIVIIRGRTSSPAEAAAIGTYARSLGYERVANLVQITEDDDAAIARLAERELSINRSLDGCEFHVQSEHGVVRVAGRVRHELQKDVAGQVLRSIDGVRSVELDLKRF